MKSKTAILTTSVSSIALIVASSAVAQDSDDVRTRDVIVVTAQKREENLQDVPIAISFVSGERLAEQSVDALKDINQLVSGISIRENNDQRNIGFLIRGVGSNQSFIGIEPSAAVNVDGEVLARNSSLFSDIGDIESVAVLKGPQGTLFGKNTVAGAMLVRTKRPSLEENEGFIRATVAQSGENAIGEYNVTGTYNQVLDDKTAVRVNFFRKDQNGWVDNVVDGPNGGSSDGFGGRIQFLRKLGDNTELLVRADYQEVDFGPGIRVFIQRDDFVIGDAFGQIPQAAFDQAVADLGLTPDQAANMLVTNLHELSNTPFGEFNDRTSALANRDYGGRDSTGFSWELNHSLPSDHELTWTFHYRDTDLFTNDSLIGTAVDAFPLNFAGPVESDTFQNEIRIASPVGKKFDYVAGVFYIHSKVTRDQKALACQDPGFENSTIDSNFNVVTCGGAPFTFDNVAGATALNSKGFAFTDTIWNREYKDNNLITDNIALFGQANFHVTDKLTAVFGGRVLFEHQDFSLFVRDAGVPNIDIRPNLLWVFDADGNRIPLGGPDSVAGGRIFVSNPFFGQETNNQGADLQQRDPSVPLRRQGKENSDTAFIYKATLQYEPTEDIMFYGNYSTGYKGVGWFTDSNIRQFDLDTRYPIPPERSRNIEAGVRTEWFDGRVVLNATYFNTKFEHYQDRLTSLDFDIFPVVNGGLQNIGNDPTASGQPVRKFDIIDAGTLKTKGFDVDAAVEITESFHVNGSWSHVNARFANTDVLIPCGAATANGADASACTPTINYGEFFDWTFPRRGQFFELDGARLANAPKDTFTVDATYDFKVGNWSSYIRWNTRYKSTEFTNHGGAANNDSSTTMPAIDIHNLFLGVSSPNDRFRFTVFVKNIFNSHYYARKTNFGDGLAERLVGTYPTVVPELVGIAQAYPTYGAVPDGRFFRQRPEHGNVPRDFDRYVGGTFEMHF